MAISQQAKIKGAIFSPFLESMDGDNSHVNSTAQAYRYVPLMFRLVRLLCNGLASVPRKFYQGETELTPEQVKALFPGTDWEEMIWKTYASKLLTGAAYWQKPKNRIRNLPPVWINPLTMTHQYRRVKETVNGYTYPRDIITFMQYANDYSQEFTQDEIVYFRDFDLRDDIGPGVSPADVAINSSALLHYQQKFARHFFENGAMPALLIGLPAGTSDTERTRVESMFKRMLSGIGNAFRVIAVKAGLIDLKTISFPLKDLALTELNGQARQSLADAFGVPLSVINDAANYATAQIHDLQLWKNTIKPEGQRIEATANAQYFAPLGLRLELDFESLDVFQEDESARAASLKTVMDFLAACPTAEIFDALSRDMGYEWSVETLDAVRKYYADKNAKPEPAPVVVATPALPEPAPVETPNPAAADLAKWHKKALKRLRAGNPAACEFESETIPTEQHERIMARLMDAQDETQVSAAFEDEREGQPERVDLAYQMKRALDYLGAAA